VLTLNVSGDTTVENDEAFTVTLSSLVGANSFGTSTAAGTIVNDDTQVSIVATSASQAEGNSGNTPFTFTVTRSGAINLGANLLYSVSGVANAADFGGTLPNGSVIFAPGQSSQVLTINVSGDTTVEADESFTVTLSALSAGTSLLTSTASGTIVTTTRKSRSRRQVRAKQKEIVVTRCSPSRFTRTGITSGVATANYAVSGVADAADFGGTLPSGTVTFTAGQTSQVVTVSVSGDTIVETDEAFNVNLFSLSGATGFGASAASGTIVNDDTSVSIVATDANKVRNGVGTTPFLFTITRTGLLTGAGSVNYQVYRYRH